MRNSIPDQLLNCAPYKATSCEWALPGNTWCGGPLVEGRSYCKTHLSMAYHSVSSEEFEQIVNSELPYEDMVEED